MAKLITFFRRLFSTISSDDHSSSLSSLTSEARKNALILSPLSPSMSTKTSKLSIMPIQLSSQSSLHTMMTKQTTINTNNINETSNSNFLSSDILKNNIHHLIASPILHKLTYHQSQHSATIVNECTEEALFSVLQYSSLPSSTANNSSCSNNIVPRLDINDDINNNSAILLSCPDARSASLNVPITLTSFNNNLINNISSTSGRSNKFSCSRNIIQYRAF